MKEKHVHSLDDLIAALQAARTEKNGSKSLLMYRDPEGNGVFTSQFVLSRDGEGDEVELIPDESTDIAS